MDLSPLNRHEKVVLQVSGGKDSIACLHLLEAYLEKITVLWLNTGNPLPEHEEQMAKIRSSVPNFLEINTELEESFQARGWPADILPIRSLVDVQRLTQQKRLPMQSFMACCMANLMLPMQEATLATGATLVIRGQKLADAHKSPVKSGDVIEGVEYWFPVEDWSDEKVLDFIEGSPWLPAHFERQNTSLDCWSCTAYASEHGWKQSYLEKHHPEKAVEVRRRMILIKNEIMGELAYMGV